MRPALCAVQHVRYATGGLCFSVSSPPASQARALRAGGDRENKKSNQSCLPREIHDSESAAYFTGVNPVKPRIDSADEKDIYLFSMVPLHRIQDRLKKLFNLACPVKSFLLLFNWGQQRPPLTILIYTTIIYLLLWIKLNLIMARR
jgi:hypothetical protein